MAFQFPQTLRAEGSTWYLVYAPDTANTMLPSLQDAKVQNVFGQWVVVPDGAGGMKKLFMSIVDLVIPQVNMPNYKKPAQYVRGFSLSPREVDPNMQPPQGMAIYTKELAPPVNVAQEFLNAVLGQSVQDAPPQEDWTQMLGGQPAQAAPRVRQVPDEAASE